MITFTYKNGIRVEIGMRGTITHADKAGEIILALLNQVPTSEFISLPQIEMGRYGE